MNDFFLHWFNSLPETDLFLKMKVLKSNISPKALYEITDTEKVYKLLADNDLRGFPDSKISLFVSEVKNGALKKKAEESFKKIGPGKINAVSLFEDNYPEKLKDIYDPPIVLYYIGNLPDKNVSSTAVVGARHPSKEGLEIAYRFSDRLSEAGSQIISGMALGIDTMAHKACVDNGRKTYAVLGSGPDVPYPVSNAKLYDLIISSGGVISEFVPGDKPVPRHFPRRNRIISGLSDRVVLIEAGEHSGSLITADFALEQGKDIYAVPGRPSDALSKGCNELIKKDGAGLITDVSDLL